MESRNDEGTTDESALNLLKPRYKTERMEKRYKSKESSRKGTKLTERSERMDPRADSSSNERDIKEESMDQNTPMTRASKSKKLISYISQKTGELGDF